MVTISTTPGVQRIFLPLPGPAPAADVALKVRNTTDQADVLLTLNRWAVEGFLMKADVIVPETGFYPGEWEYTLSFKDVYNNTIKASGLMCATAEGEDGPVQYNQEINYKQYGE